MWEAIRANQRRSRLLIGLMGSILAALGALMGAFYAGPEAAAAGALAALVVWLVMLLAALGGGERLLLAGSRARKVEKQQAPRLWNVVEEMTIASGLGKMPAVYVIDDDMPNAFAAGRSHDTACVAVTSGLLRRLNRDELQGVIAHEIAHIKNLDVRFLTIAAVMVGSVAIISDVFFRSLWFGGGRKRDVRGGGGQAQAIIAIVTVVVAILAPICTQLLYYAVSRRREYLADASGARFTRYPEGLASALEKITTDLRPGKGVMRVLAPMYIVNPLQLRGAVGLFSTHPPTHKRVEILRAMGGMAGWVDYERAFKQVMGQDAKCLDSQTLGAEGSVAARAAQPEPEPRQAAVERAKEVHELLDRMVNFLFLTCVCGVQIRVPPGVTRDAVRCPRCGREHALPREETERQQPAPADETPQSYRRQGEGWETFPCRCGQNVELSPGFRGDAVRCKACRRRIEIRSV